MAMNPSCKTICSGCNKSRILFSGLVCPSCKVEEHAREKAARLERARLAAERGTFDDPRAAVANLARFDTFARDVREAAGCPRRSA